jgi:hypothetical protein
MVQKKTEKKEKLIPAGYRTWVAGSVVCIYITTEPQEHLGKRWALYVISRGYMYM